MTKMNWELNLFRYLEFIHNHNEKEITDIQFSISNLSLLITPVNGFEKSCTHFNQKNNIKFKSKP